MYFQLQLIHHPHDCENVCNKKESVLKAYTEYCIRSNKLLLKKEKEMDDMRRQFTEEIHQKEEMIHQREEEIKSRKVEEESLRKKLMNQREIESSIELSHENAFLRAQLENCTAQLQQKAQERLHLMGEIEELLKIQRLCCAAMLYIIFHEYNEESPSHCLLPDSPSVSAGDNHFVGSGIEHEEHKVAANYGYTPPSSSIDDRLSTETILSEILATPRIDRGLNYTGTSTSTREEVGVWEYNSPPNHTISSDPPSLDNSTFSLSEYSSDYFGDEEKRNQPILYSSGSSSAAGWILYGIAACLVLWLINLIVQVNRCLIYAYMLGAMCYRLRGTYRKSTAIVALGVQRYHALTGLDS